MDGLILIEQQRTQLLDQNFLLMPGVVPYSPISALDGIDFGKVLSTRGDKTFINELTSG